MRSLLLYPDREFDVQGAVPDNSDDLAADLELGVLWHAMAGDDAQLRQIARAGLLQSMVDPDEIRYRQDVVRDAQARPEMVHRLFTLANGAIAEERRISRGFLSLDRPATVLERSVRVLDAFTAILRDVREVGRQHAEQARSMGFRQLFRTLESQLDDAYVDAVEGHLKRLHLGDGLVTSARLGEGNVGTDYVLRVPREENRTFFGHVALKKPTRSYVIADRDEAGHSALRDLKDHILNEVANVTAQAAEHVRGFFAALRDETGFLVACLALRERLLALGLPIEFPIPDPGDDVVISADGLYDPCLALRLDAPIVSSDLKPTAKPVIVITGANQGGKSTLLRSLGLAQLMTQAGMFVAAGSLSVRPAVGIFTHCKREEDTTMASGKFDEELARMRRITDRVGQGALVLCNESFAATNESEGSAIALEVVGALIDRGVRVGFVTHLYDFARTLQEKRADDCEFLRAERLDSGERTFRVIPGAPLPTSYGQDLYRRIFARSTRSGTEAGQLNPAADQLHAPVVRPLS